MKRLLATLKSRNFQVFQRVFLIFSFVLMLITMVLPPDTSGLPAVFGPSRADAQAVATCPDLVKKAVTTVGGRCSNTARNSACYGNGSLEVVAQEGVSDLKFSNPGDKAQLTTIRSLRLGALDAASQGWGIALLRLQANLPDTVRGQNVTMLLFGDVEITDAAGDTSTAAATSLAGTLTSVAPTIDAADTPIAGTSQAGNTLVYATIAARNTDRAATLQGRLANQEVTKQARAASQNPTQQDRATDQYSTLAARSTSQQSTANARSTVIQSTQFARGTVQASTVQAPPKPVVYKPMQAFYFTTGIGEAACKEAPRDGILVQTPTANTEIKLVMNGVEISLGSTAFLQARRSGEMIISTIEGAAGVTAQGKSVAAVAGTRVRVPMDANLNPAGPPSAPEPYIMADLEALPLRILPKRITKIPDPLGQIGPGSLVSSSNGEACTPGGVTMGLTNPASQFGVNVVGQYGGERWTVKAGTTATFSVSGSLRIQTYVRNYINLISSKIIPAQVAEGATFAGSGASSTWTHTFPKDRTFFIGIGMASPGTATLKVSCVDPTGGAGSGGQSGTQATATREAGTKAP
jgi:hypothetical protein